MFTHQDLVSICVDVLIWKFRERSAASNHSTWFSFETSTFCFKKNSTKKKKVFGISHAKSQKRIN